MYPTSTAHPSMNAKQSCQNKIILILNVTLSHSTSAGVLMHSVFVRRKKTSDKKKCNATVKINQAHVYGHELTASRQYAGAHSEQLPFLNFYYIYLYFLKCCIVKHSATTTL